MDLDIPDFTDAERRVVAGALRERFRAQFFYSPDPFHRAGRSEDGSLTDCGLDILRAPAHLERIFSFAPEARFQ